MDIEADRQAGGRWYLVTLDDGVLTFVVGNYADRLDAMDWAYLLNQGERPDSARLYLVLSGNDPTLREFLRQEGRAA